VSGISEPTANDSSENRAQSPSCPVRNEYCAHDPLRHGVRTLLPPTRTSQLNVYEASGVDRAFGHKYELSAVNAPSRVDEDRKETERRLRFYSKTSPTIKPKSTDFLHLITRNLKIINKNINIFNPINTILIKLIIIRLYDYTIIKVIYFPVELQNLIIQFIITQVIKLTHCY